MSSNSFDLITQELLKHRQAMERLQAENRELRQQLTDLRAGRGIFIQINGKCFPVKAAFVSQAFMQVPTVQPSCGVEPAVSPSIEKEPMPAIPEAFSAKNSASIMPSQNTKQVAAEISTFLEEAMVGEFATALGSPLIVLQDPVHKLEEIAEEQKAALRRELSGSYLLE